MDDLLGECPGFLIRRSHQIHLAGNEHGCAPMRLA